ncbi:MAG: hypothetical protein WCT18_04320 [Patescibacteria group bacterium]
MPNRRSFEEKFQTAVKKFQTENSNEEERRKKPYDALRQSVEQKLVRFNAEFTNWQFHSESFSKYLNMIFQNGDSRICLVEQRPIIRLGKNGLSVDFTADNQELLDLETFFEQTTFENFLQLLFHKFKEALINTHYSETFTILSRKI